LPVRAPDVERVELFDSNVDALRGKYPDIDAVVDDIEARLLTAEVMDHVVASDSDLRIAYADYPPHGKSGLDRFIVVYRAVKVAKRPNMQKPEWAYTLMAIKETVRPPPAGA
jgi:hypothetical protein